VKYDSIQLEEFRRRKETEYLHKRFFRDWGLVAGWVVELHYHAKGRRRQRANQSRLPWRTPCAGETPAHSNVEPVDKVRPAKAYMLSQDDVKEFSKYEKLWKELFQIR